MKKDVINKLQSTVNKPRVICLDSFKPIMAELGPRLAYDSIEKSENSEFLNEMMNSGVDGAIEKYGEKDASGLLEHLVWVEHHNSVIEHICVSFYIENISRAVLQELARHRLASYTVVSTRYTLGEMVYASIVPYILDRESNVSDSVEYLYEKSDKFFVINKKSPVLKRVIESFVEDVLIIFKEIMDEDVTLILTAGQLNYLKDNYEKPLNTIVSNLISSELRSKKNLGDYFKTILPESLSVSLQWTINARSLNNFMKLRDSGAAYWEMRNLAKEVWKAIPDDIKRYIVKDK